MHEISVLLNIQYFDFFKHLFAANMTRTKEKEDEIVAETSTGAAAEEIFTVEKIVDMRVKGGKKEYLLKWKGNPE